MKNPMKVLLAMMFLATTFLSASAFAFDNTSIKKIIIKGNARVLLVQRDAEEVVIQEYFSPANTTVSKVGLSLVINSTEPTPLKITIYTKAPFRVEAFNNVSVETIGDINLQYLQIFLHDKATARISSNTVGLYTTVNHSARLTLEGSSEDHVSVRSIGSRIQSANLTCAKTNTSYFIPITSGKRLTAKNVTR